MPFLDIQERVNDGANEQGLLGLAFHPRYAENGYFFVNYTGANDETVIARFSVTSDPNRADPASEKVILTIDQPYRNHNGGDLAFGPDGYLYVGMGDGGSAGDPEQRAQNPQSLLGKMLRLDVDNGDPYGIPTDNPFVTRGDVALEIWAYGLRNPWRFSFDRATGDLYIADVGQNAIEEVNIQPADSAGGENYGWDFLEGSQPFEGAAPADTVLPVAEYARGDGCSVTGGYVYRGAALPELNGVYFFGDYCSGLIWSLQRDAAGAWRRATFGETDFNIGSFGEDAAGELYVLDHRGGGVYQIVRR
jgi:glucose/arabinose dehydrogenase